MRTKIFSIGNAACFFAVCFFAVCFFFVIALSTVSSVFAQKKFYPLGSPTDRAGQGKQAGKYRVEFEILTSRQGGVGLKAQQWGRVFSKMPATARVRRERFNERIQTTEKKFGLGKMVLVVAKIAPSGALVCNDRKFSMNQQGKLKEWIEELQTFGVQGAPEGKPVWGLSRQQFDKLNTTLKKPLKGTVKEKTITAALKSFQLQNPAPQNETTLRISESARDHLLKSGALQKVSQELEKVSQGTALTILLSEYGLCFRPRRTSTKEILLMIEPKQGIADPWPVGWQLESVPLKGLTPNSKPNHRMQLAPKLFERTLVSLSEIPAQKVLDSIARQSTLPIYYDFHSIRKKKVDLNTVLVSYPQRKASWNQVLKSVMFQSKLKAELLVDEAARPFIWVTVPTYGKKPS